MFLHFTPRILLAAAFVATTAVHGTFAQDTQSGWGNVEVVPEPEAPKKKKKPVTQPAAGDAKAAKSKATSKEPTPQKEAAPESTQTGEPKVAPAESAKPATEAKSPPPATKPAAAKVETEPPPPAKAETEPGSLPAKAEAVVEEAPAATAAQEPSAGEQAASNDAPSPGRKAVSAAPGLVVVTPELPIGMPVPDSLTPRAP